MQDNNKDGSIRSSEIFERREIFVSREKNTIISSDRKILIIRPACVFGDKSVKFVISQNNR